MKKIFAVLISSPLIIPLPAFAESQLLDRVIAVVNDEAITQSELDAFLRPVYEQYKGESQGEALMQRLGEARQKLLNQLIEDRLVFQEAKKQAIQPEDAEVDAQMEEFKKKFKSEEELEEALKKEGLSLGAMRERLERQSMIRQLHDREIRARILVSPLDVEEYFESHPGEFSTEDRLKVRSMTIKKSEESKLKGLMDEDAKKKIEGLRRRVASGEDFGKLAQEFSEDAQADKGGLGDWIERGAMIQVIDEAIFNLKVGEPSEIIESPMGYHFFRVEEKEPGRKRNLEESRDEIFSKLLREKSAGRFREWMNTLKRSAYISIR